jgi:hypothetical protein
VSQPETAELLHELVLSVDPDDLCVGWASLPADHQEHWRALAAELPRLLEVVR